jgi:hypothetical protein
MKIPETTASKRARSLARMDEAGVQSLPSRVVSPPLTAEYLTAKYGPSKLGEAQPFHGTFTAPIDLTPRQWEQARNQAIERFVTAMYQQGLWLASEKRIQVNPGVYPARDLATQQDDFNQREYIVTGHFYNRYPELVRVEIPEHMREPQTLG